MKRQFNSFTNKINTYYFIKKKKDVFFKADTSVAPLKSKVLYRVRLKVFLMTFTKMIYIDHIDLIFKIKPKPNKYIQHNAYVEGII